MATVRTAEHGSLTFSEWLKGQRVLPETLTSPASSYPESRQVRLLRILPKILTFYGSTQIIQSIQVLTM